ncbi:MAG: DegT/DnrJ/EryC1/StrS family aminotransferase [Patescibacteria group bacterium]
MKTRSAPHFHFNHTQITFRKNIQDKIKMVNKVISSGIFFNGKEVKKLIKNLLNFMDQEKYLVTTASGHDSLIIALSSLKLNSSDEVIFPVNAYPTVFPIFMSGVKPVPVDVDENGQIDILNLEKSITNHTKAIVIVHLYGLTCDVNKVKEIIKKRNITLIEDAAQAFGTTYKDRHVGTLGDIGCFSFYPTKNLATVGDGGALWTRDKKLYEYFLQVKSYGEKERYYSLSISGHSRIPEIQAGILNLYFKRIKRDFKKRKEKATYYHKSIIQKNLSPYMRVLQSDPHSSPVRHLFVVEAKERNSLKKYLAKKKIETHIHYPYPIHLVPAFSYLGYKNGDFPIAERLSRNIISLPFHPFLAKKEIDYIIKSIKNHYG